MEVSKLMSDVEDLLNDVNNETDTAQQAVRLTYDLLLTVGSSDVSFENGSVVAIVIDNCGGSKFEMS